MALVHRVGWDGRFARRSPWFWPLQAAAAGFVELEDWPSREQLTETYRQLNQGPGVAPLRFVPNVRKQDRLVDGALALERLYDGSIATRCEVPTRERDWHDFFNALCFATFPRAKHALHARQFRILQGRVPAGATRLPPARTPEQDALTLFDEGGALIAAGRQACVQLQAPMSLEQREQLLAQLVERGDARVVPFGHALFEHLVEGLRCPGGFSHVVEVEHVAAADADLIAELDRSVARSLQDRARFLSPKEGAQLRLSATESSDA